MVLVAMATLRMVAPYLLAVFMGGILALLFYPLYRYLRDQKTMKPRASATVVTVGMVLVIMVPLILFVVAAVRQGIVVGQAVANNEDLSFEILQGRLSNIPGVETFIGKDFALEESLKNMVRNAAKTVTGVVLNLGTQAPGFLLQLALACLACFFLLIDGRRFLDWIIVKIPLDPDVRQSFRASFKNTAVSVIWATLAAAASQAAVMWLAFLVLRVPGGFLAAGATFIFAWIPMIGSAPVWLAGAFYLMLQKAWIKVILMLLCGVAASLIDNLVRPAVLKGRDDMHPLVSLVAIFGGINMFGILGVFVGPILAALLTSFLETWPLVASRFGLALGGPPPKAPPAAEKTSV